MATNKRTRTQSVTTPRTKTINRVQAYKVIYDKRQTRKK